MITDYEFKVSKNFYLASGWSFSLLLFWLVRCYSQDFIPIGGVGLGLIILWLLKDFLLR